MSVPAKVVFKGRILVRAYLQCQKIKKNNNNQIHKIYSINFYDGFVVKIEERFFYAHITL